ncbi:hypothetical protein CL1_0318 [Thermococcus cleftensis]|uniref:Uncharacterized protein n=1 Tax=Thermococcus cleftensis (strain DSM 27260 / KACC 17922 / CL1) TaxID=163003 RepID=I3ZS45_THECF|nr:hypothetical protein [Thermococcus cleftensis]AFL94529.1 hypothetical protein CL1_0318 [Thermococcus cleftensis]
MTLCSKYRYLLLFLFAFIGVESWKYGIKSGINSLVGIVLGLIIVFTVAPSVRKLGRRVYKGIYCRLGFDIVYEFLLGKSGKVKQFFSIFILISTPLFMLNAYSSTQFWLFIVPMSAITTMIVYCSFQETNTGAG